MAVLEDERLGFGPFYSECIWGLERSFLLHWAGANNIPALLSIDKFLRPKPWTLLWESRRLRLGRTPHQNFLEIIRKVPMLFGAASGTGAPAKLYESTMTEAAGVEGFNESFNSAIERLGHSLFSYGNLATLDDEALLSHTPQFLKNLYHSFLNAMTKEGEQGADWQQKTLLYLCRALFHQKFTLNASRVELFLLFIGLLCEHYELDALSLSLELKHHYQKLGGEFRQTQVTSVKKENRAPWCLELSTFEGWILPTKIFLFAGDLRHYPLRVKTDKELSIGIEFKWQLRHPIESSLDGERIISSKVSRMGTNFPLWFGEFKGNEITICTFTSLGKGTKLDFVTTYLREALIEDLRPLCGELGPLIVSEKVRELPEIWSTSSEKDKDTLGMRRPPVSVFSGPGKGNSLKGITYFGPIAEAGPGLLSTLMDMRDPRPYLF